jgi:hypothetical protein
MLAEPPISQLMTVEPIESPERLGCISDIRPIKLKPSARVVRLRPVEIFWKCRDVFIVGIGWFFASGLRRLSADLTVRYRVQMILGYPVSEFAKKKQERASRNVLVSQGYAEILGLRVVLSECLISPPVRATHSAKETVNLLNALTVEPLISKDGFLFWKQLKWSYALQ